MKNMIQAKGLHTADQVGATRTEDSAIGVKLRKTPAEVIAAARPPGKEHVFIKYGCSLPIEVTNTDDAGARVCEADSEKLESLASSHKIGHFMHIHTHQFTVTPSFSDFRNFFANKDIKTAVIAVINPKNNELMGYNIIRKPKDFNHSGLLCYIQKSEVPEQKTMLSDILFVCEHPVQAIRSIASGIRSLKADKEALATLERGYAAIKLKAAEIHDAMAYVYEHEDLDLREVYTKFGLMQRYLPADGYIVNRYGTAFIPINAQSAEELINFLIQTGESW